jgi:hypothetical protein
MSFSITGMATATRSGHKKRTQAIVFGKYFVIKSNITRQELPMLLGG